MNFEERQAEIERLRRGHREALCVPLMSEGAISPMQVGMMTDKQKGRWQRLAQERMQVESQIRLLSRPDNEIREAEQKELKKKIDGRLLQIDNMIATLSRFTGKNGKILPKYAREIEKLQNERLELTK